jgi:putative membrane protein
MRAVLAGEAASWTFVPDVAAGLAAWALAYAALVARRWRVRHRIAWRRLIAWCCGLAVIALAIMSPLDALADDRSFAAHMLQHEMLLTVAPLLLLMGLDAQLLAPLTRWVIRPALRRPRATRLLRAVTAPALALGAWTACVVTWSIPAMVALASRDETVHNAEHLQFIVVGLLFWAVILAPFPSLHRPDVPRKLAYLAIVCAVGGALAALLAFDPANLYRVPYAGDESWLGLSAVGEQRVAAALMMAIDMPAVLAAAVWVASRGPIRTEPPRSQACRPQPPRHSTSASSSARSRSETAPPSSPSTPPMPRSLSSIG